MCRYLHVASALLSFPHSFLLHHVECNQSIVIKNGILKCLLCLGRNMNKTCSLTTFSISPHPKPLTAPCSQSLTVYFCVYKETAKNLFLRQKWFSYFPVKYLMLLKQDKFTWKAKLLSLSFLSLRENCSFLF